MESVNAEIDKNLAEELAIDLLSKFNEVRSSGGTRGQFISEATKIILREFVNIRSHLSNDKDNGVISKYMSELGKKSAFANKKKGTDYFKWVRSHGK